MRFGVPTLVLVALALSAVTSGSSAQEPSGPLVGMNHGARKAVMLACLPGKQHELGLIAFGLALRAHGWRISYFGGNTPLETVDAAASDLEPRLIVLSAVASEPIEASLSHLRNQRVATALRSGARELRTSSPTSWVC
jgi:methanogenic corrinoid protein MtbC1